MHIYIFYRLFLWAAESLIMDATYSMNLNQIFFLSPESFLALLIFTILGVCAALYGIYHAFVVFDRIYDEILRQVGQRALSSSVEMPGGSI